MGQMLDVQQRMANDISRQLQIMLTGSGSIINVSATAINTPADVEAFLKSL